MKDNMTEEQRYMRWMNMVEVSFARGWRCVCGWDFIAPDGTVHDLSAIDPTKLHLLERTEAP